MLAFKGTKADLTCINQQYELNETYECKNLSVCSSGYHFTKKLKDVRNYYPFSNTHRFFIISADGDIESRGDKSATNKITFLEEISMDNIENIMKNYNNLLHDNFDGIFLIACHKYNFAIGVRTLFDRIKSYIQNNNIENSHMMYLNTLTANDNFAFNWSYNKKHKDIVKILNDEYKELYKNKTINSREYLNLIKANNSHLVNYVRILLGLSG